MKNIIIDTINNNIIYNNINGKQKLKPLAEFKTNYIVISDYNVVIIKTDNNIINYQLSYYDTCDIIKKYVDK